MSKRLDSIRLVGKQTLRLFGFREKKGNIPFECNQPSKHPPTLLGWPLGIFVLADESDPSASIQLLCDPSRTSFKDCQIYADIEEERKRESAICMESKQHESSNWLALGYWLLAFGFRLSVLVSFRDRVGARDRATRRPIQFRLLSNGFSHRSAGLCIIFVPSIGLWDRAEIWRKIETQPDVEAKKITYVTVGANCGRQMRDNNLVQATSSFELAKNEIIIFSRDRNGNRTETRRPNEQWKW